jgi:ribosomal protein S18 acetylase RimI-like enzyme
VIAYIDSLDGITPERLTGFFVDWPHPPSPEVHLRLLIGSDFIVLAIDEESGQVVGYVTALSDGVLSAFIPLLEVVPAYQGQGIGQRLMREILARLAHLPNVDLGCDSDLVPFYERFGMRSGTSMMLRRPLARLANTGVGSGEEMA